MGSTGAPARGFRRLAGNVERHRDGALPLSQSFAYRTAAGRGEAPRPTDRAPVLPIAVAPLDTIQKLHVSTHAPSIGGLHAPYASPTCFSTSGGGPGKVGMATLPM